MDLSQPLRDSAENLLHTVLRGRVTLRIVRESLCRIEKVSDNRDGGVPRRGLRWSSEAWNSQCAKFMRFMHDYKARGNVCHAWRHI